MKRYVTRCKCFCAALLVVVWAAASRAQTSNVVTGQYNNSRNGANLGETVLTPSTVSPDAFGFLFSQTVDAVFNAQPLYVQGLTIGNAVHNVVFVATMHDSVYAFDADTSQPPLWHVSLGTPVTTAAGIKLGILSTPVIDIGAKTIFVTSYTSETGASVYRLHALNLLTGAEITNVAVQGAVPGSGDGSQTTACAAANGAAIQPPCIPFVASQVLQRPALLEDPGHGTIYLAFGVIGGGEATRPYHGWLIGYSYSSGTFTQTTIFNTTQNATQVGQPCTGASPATNQCGHGGGIWMSGRGPALDPAGIYLVTGNGGYGGAGTGNWGESVLRVSGAAVVQDSFTPNNFAFLNDYDLDLGNAGPILFTSTNPTVSRLLLTAGKAGIVYVMNRARLGGFTASNSGVLQAFTATPQGCGTGPGQSECFEIHSTALWARSNASQILYIWPYGDVLRAWDFNTSTNQFAPDANQGTLPVPYYPGGGLAVSANGNRDGIVWGTAPLTGTSPGQGALYAFDATNVGKQLWASTDYWFATKFTIPTVANGKVYVQTSGSPASVSPAYSPALRVYGLCLTCAIQRTASMKRPSGLQMRPVEKIDARLPRNNTR